MFISVVIISVYGDVSSFYVQEVRNLSKAVTNLGLGICRDCSFAKPSAFKVKAVGLSGETLSTEISFVAIKNPHCQMTQRRLTVTSLYMSEGVKLQTNTPYTKNVSLIRFLSFKCIFIEQRSVIVKRFEHTHDPPVCR